MGPCGKHYLILIGLWGGLNLIYLVWFFGSRNAAKQIQLRLEKSTKAGYGD
jgi:hypothetical protein